MSLLLLSLALFLTRLIGLNWGWPFYFHPDENNIAIAISQLSCPSIFDLKHCLEPGFYAYGQIFLYLGRAVNLFFNNPNLSLRVLSALSSILGGWLFYKLIKRDFKSEKAGRIGLLFFIFTPVLIQLAHFGTTESFSIFLFINLLYYRHKSILSGLFIGLLIATKVSHGVLLILPLLFFRFKGYDFKNLLVSWLTALVVFLVFNPHNLLNWEKFIYSMSYELSIGSGILPVFYTQQFAHSLPLWFQISSILPFAVGPMLMALSFLGVFSLIKNKQWDIVLLLLLLFVQAGFTYVKWTRFLALVYPLLIYSSVSALIYVTAKFKAKKSLILFVLVAQTIMGVGFLKLYLVPDIRLQANSWINQNIKPNAIILTEGANVVDLPTNSSKFRVYSFFLYDLDRDSRLAKQVFSVLEAADYVVVPSRRVYVNYTCYRFKKQEVTYEQNCSIDKQNPKIDKYYQELFLSGKFELEKSFTVLNDEYSEETWTVFDHPQVRIFKRVK